MARVSKFFQKTLSNRRAFTVVEVLVAVGISSIVLVGTATLVTSELNPKKNVESYFWLSQLRTEIVTSLKKKPVFDSAILNPANSSMACLKPKVAGGGTASLDCSGQGGQILILSDALGKTLVDNTSPTAGFDKTGSPCTDFSDTSTDCQYQIQLSWEPVCPATGKCFNPDIKIEGKLVVSKAHKQPLNPDLYGFRWILATTEKADVVCDTSGIGTSSGADCKMNIETKCPAGEFLVGFNLNGSPICKTMTEQKCVGGLLQGFDNSGKKVCGSSCH